MAAALASTLLSGCLLASFEVADTVFTEADSVVPRGMASTYRSGPPQEEGYYAFTQVRDRLFIEEAYLRNTEQKAGEPEWLYVDALLTPRLRFAALNRNRYVAWYETTTKRQELGVVAVDETGAAIWNFSTIPEERRIALAAGRGLTLTKGAFDNGKIEGAVSSSTIRGFFSDLVDENPTSMPVKPAEIPPALEIAHFAPGPRLSVMVQEQLLKPAFEKYPTGSDLIKWLEQVDKRGNPWGAYILARLYGNGWIVQHDPARARRLAEDAVARGLPQAKQVLAFLTWRPDDEAAVARSVALYTEAAQAGDGRAMYVLSELYRTGKGVEQSEQKAVEWLRKAVDAGVPDAQVALAQRLFEGRGVPTDNAAGVELMNKAAGAGYAAAQAGLGWLHAEDTGVVKTNDAEARAWYLKAANLGHPWAQWQLGDWLLSGRGGEKDTKAAIEWLERAIAAGETRAKESLKNAIDARIQEVERKKSEAERRMAEIKRKIEENEKKLCGERRCQKLEDGRWIYKARTLNAWHFSDGRMAPPETWPR